MFQLKLENVSGNVVDINDGIQYVVKSVSGLNPPSASIFTSKSPNRKGLRYNGSTLNERMLNIEVKILGDIEANRNALYDWVDPEQYSKIYYRNETKNVYCEGYVESCEVDLFSDNEIVNVQILCPKPYWNDLQIISTEISNILKQFTFPFAIDSAGIPFSTLLEDNKTRIFNGGAETGVQIYIRGTEDIVNLIIYDVNTASRNFKINYTIPAGWVVEIDTEASPKTCKAIKPDGSIVNLMKYLSNPTWFTLKKGSNQFGFSADSGANSAEISIRFTNKYLGV